MWTLPCCVPREIMHILETHKIYHCENIFTFHSCFEPQSLFKCEVREWPKCVRFNIWYKNSSTDFRVTVIFDLRTGKIHPSQTHTYIYQEKLLVIYKCVLCSIKRIFFNWIRHIIKLKPELHSSGAEIKLPSNFPAIVLITCNKQRAAVPKHSASIRDIIKEDDMTSTDEWICSGLSVH